MKIHVLFSLLLLTSACSGSAVDIGDLVDGGAPITSAPAADGSATSKPACDIDGITGTFAVTYTLQSGTCGPIAGQDYTLAPNAMWNTPGCAVRSKKTSADRCVSTGSADCLVGTAQEHVEGAITQTSDDAMDGTVSFAITSTAGSCSGTYAIAYRRK